MTAATSNAPWWLLTVALAIGCTEEPTAGSTSTAAATPARSPTAARRDPVTALPHYDEHPPPQSKVTFHAVPTRDGFAFEFAPSISGDGNDRVVATQLVYEMCCAERTTTTIEVRRVRDRSLLRREVLSAYRRQELATDRGRISVARRISEKLHELNLWLAERRWSRLEPCAGTCDLNLSADGSPELAITTPAKRERPPRTRPIPEWLRVDSPPECEGTNPPYIHATSCDGKGLVAVVVGWQDLAGSHCTPPAPETFFLSEPHCAR